MEESWKEEGAEVLLLAEAELVVERRELFWLVDEDMPRGEEDEGEPEVTEEVTEAFLPRENIEEKAALMLDLWLRASWPGKGNPIMFSCTRF